jgi:hypothetical protein
VNITGSNKEEEDIDMKIRTRLQAAAIASLALVILWWSAPVRAGQAKERLDG